MTDRNLRKILPRDKLDLDRARAVVEAGYPAVAPILPDLLEWLKDYNWPVAQVLQPFLASIGTPLVPEIRRVLQTEDTIWKYWIILCIVRESAELAMALKQELEQIIAITATDEDKQYLIEAAQETLKKLGSCAEDAV